MQINVTEKDTRVRTELEMDSKLIKVIGLQNAYMYYVLKEIQRAQDCSCRYYYQPPINEYSRFSSIPFLFSEYDKEFFAEETYIQQYFGIPTDVQKMLLYNLERYGLINLRIEGFFCRAFVTLNVHTEYYYIQTGITITPKERIFEQLDDFMATTEYVNMVDILAWQRAFDIQDDMFITPTQATTLCKLNTYRYMYIAIMDNELSIQPFIDNGTYGSIMGNDNDICSVPLNKFEKEDIQAIYDMDGTFVNVIYDSRNNLTDDVTEQDYIAVELNIHKLDEAWKTTEYYKYYIDTENNNG